MSDKNIMIIQGQQRWVMPRVHRHFSTFDGPASLGTAVYAFFFGESAPDEDIRQVLPIEQGHHTSRLQTPVNIRLQRTRWTHFFPSSDSQAGELCLFVVHFCMDFYPG
uniref:Uncharacterized protein n=1 Tax=Eutreptiella gymnastica TaxID=73025 RepID=A0A7S1HYW8_9EUGL